MSLILLSPNLRFPGFEEDWETVGFGSYISFKTTNSFSRENLNYGNGTVKNIHYGDIHTQFQTLFDVTKEKVPFIDKGLNISRISEDSFCKEGDIIFADASENLNDVGKSIEIVNLNDEKVLSGLHTLLARPIENKFEKGFLGYLLKSKNARLQIQKESQGSKVLSINAGRLSTISLSYPNIHEQKRIANFFSLLDEKISTQKKTIENLESLKSSLLNKIFKRKNEFYKNKNWEERQLAQISHEHQDKNKKNLHNEVFSVAKNKGVINQIEHLGRSFSASDISNYKLIYPGDLVYTKSPTSDFPFGIIKQNRTNRIGVVSPLYCVFTPQSFALGYLIHEYFESAVNTFNYLNPLVQKGAKNTMNINNDTFLNGAELFLPIGEREQGKLYKLFSSINQKIEIELRILEKLNQQKKYFLQNLFI